MKNNISEVYFIGIGGIGMSALARYFLAGGARVSGYDRVPSDITTSLIEEGVEIHFDEDVDRINKNADLYIYTPAIPDDHKELEWIRKHHLNLKKRSEALADITADGFSICIAGTHGKTTTSTLTAHILRSSGYGCTAFLGGISRNYNTNFWMGHNDVNVIEADEYDRSFLKLSPDIASISAMDADHLDIYGTLDNMREAFRQFGDSVIKKDGLLVYKYGLSVHDKSQKKSLSYALQNESADVYARNVVMKDGGYEFDIYDPAGEVSGCRLNMGGMYNVENTVAAVSIANRLKIDTGKIRDAIATFRGVHRRFEYVIDVSQAKKNPRDVVFIDDYGHHPKEVEAMLKGARSLFNDRWITIIFQPHLYSRTRDLYRGFASALALANTVVLMPIYPARELPIEGVSSQLIADKITGARVMIKDKQEVLEWLSNDYKKETPHSLSGDVLITAGAGDIDRLVYPIKEILSND